MIKKSEIEIRAILKRQLYQYRCLKNWLTPTAKLLPFEIWGRNLASAMPPNYRMAADMGAHIDFDSTVSK